MGEGRKGRGRGGWVGGAGVGWVGGAGVVVGRRAGKVGGIFQDSRFKKDSRFKMQSNNNIVVVSGSREEPSKVCVCTIVLPVV